MSHFSVLVIGENPERQLAPYHEFECTGVNDEFVQEIDRTEEVRAEYLRQTEPRLLSPNRTTLHSFFDRKGDWVPEFSRIENPEDKALFHRRVEFIPPGYSRIELPVSQLVPFAEWVKDWYGYAVVPFGEAPDTEGRHKFGYVLVDERGEMVRCVKRTNPNSKWDWWVVGGRWTGYLKAKPGVQGELGKTGAFNEPAEPGYYDSLLVGEIDFEGMAADAADKAGEQYDAFYRALGTHALPPRWEEFRQKFGDDLTQAREAYWALPAMQRLQEARVLPIMRDAADVYGCTREEFCRRAARKSVVPYAVVKDGQWYAKGEMWWWAISTNEVSEEEWNDKVYELLTSLPSDTRITVIDCHI